MIMRNVSHNYLDEIQDAEHMRGIVTAITALTAELRRQHDEDRVLERPERTASGRALFETIKGTPEWHEAQAMNLMADVDRIAYSPSYRASDKALDVKRAQVHATLALSKRTGMK